MKTSRNLISIDKAVQVASRWTKKTLTQSNISYLVQYGRLEKHKINGQTLISQNELEKYYKEMSFSKETEWKQKLGSDLNWSLSFSNYREKETTKHVHRLHPYKGKFIPQLVEYFLDSKVDSFKKKPYFKKGDIVIDPFCGSGTTLVQANELGINCLGIDISIFNTLISNIKCQPHNIQLVQETLNNLTKNLDNFSRNKMVRGFSNELSRFLLKFNQKYFPSPQFKRDVLAKKINDKIYGEEKAKIFLQTFKRILNKYNVQLDQNKEGGDFLDTWFLLPIRKEIDFMSSQLESIRDDSIRQLIMIILSRTIRSCRATTHSDLGTLKKAINKPYYCKKHGKICNPILSISKRWNQYCKDTISRLEEFSQLRTKTQQLAITGDSRTVDILKRLKKQDFSFYKLLKNKKIKGIFTSPPYVGLIDYHEQHAYSYDLFGLERKDDLEIGPLFKGQGRDAKNSYADSISKVLLNCKKFMQDDFDILLVANDKYNLYPEIAEKAKLKITQKYKRPVLNRIEKDRSAYSEYIFHMKSI